MKANLLAIFAAMTGMVLAATANAQVNTSPGNWTYYQDDPAPASPSDAVVPPPAETEAMEEAEVIDNDAPVGDCGCCTSSCLSCGLLGELTCHLPGCCGGDAWKLWDNECSCIDIGGHFQAGYTTYNTGMFNNHPFEVDLNQAWLYLEKSADSDSCCWDVGYRVDYVYGTDGPDTQAFFNRPDNFDEGWDHGNFYGHAIPQAYVEFARDGLSVKVGHFFTVVGYEVVPATGNFFYSHAFTMFNSEPFTHTGVLAEYTTCDDTTVYAGYVAGWDTGFDHNEGDQFIGGFSRSLSENATLTYIFLAGTQGQGNPNSDGYNHSVVLDVELCNDMNYVLQSDYVDYAGLNQSYGVNQYLFKDLNDCWKAGVRAEWWHTIHQPGQNRGIGSSDLYNVTAGLNYQAHPNLRIRPEVRWTHDGDGILTPADENHTWLWGMDAILTF